MATNTELDPKLVENQQQQAQSVPELTLNVNVNELNIIIAGLQELPHRVVDPIIKKIFQQAQAQLGQS
jgi:hypothetical protein